MAISLTHKFTSAKSDGVDATRVQPSNWNDEHDLELASGRLLGRTTAGAGAVEEISVSADLTLASLALGLSFTVTAFAKTLLDDADAAAMRTTLGLDAIDGTVIGAATPAAGTFTTAEAESLRIESAVASIDLRDTNSGVGLKQSRIEVNNDQFTIGTWGEAGNFVNFDYVMVKGTAGATEHSFRVGGTERLEVTNFGIVTANGSFSGNVSPIINATFNLGADFFRWANVFLSNSPNVSSDARLKEDFAPYTETDLAAARLFESQTFRLKASGKPTSGYVAQQIIEAFEQAGLSPEDAAQRPVDLGLMEMGEDGMWGMHYELVNALRLKALIG